MEYNLTRMFKKNTLTGQRVELLETDMLWTRKPVSVYLKVRSKEPITPKQVRLVQEFLGEKMRRNFELIVLVDAITEVRAEEPPLYMQKPEKKDQVTKKITNQDIKKVRILKRKTKP